MTYFTLTVNAPHTATVAYLSHGEVVTMVEELTAAHGPALVVEVRAYNDDTDSEHIYCGD